MDKFLKTFDNHPHWKDGLLCFFSAGLLMLAFPKTDLGWAAWVGLIPLMSALDGKRPWAAFRSGYLCGVLFFAGTFYWFLHIARWFSYIAVIGVILLFLYLALYFGLFALGYSFFSRRKLLSKLFLLPSVWVVLEFIRTRLFTGFDWACLGHSQYKNLLLIQIADVTGVLGVSFVVVMVNVFLKGWLTARLAACRVSAAKKLSVSSVLTVAMLGFLILGYGAFRLLLPAGQVKAASRLSVVIIQADIPQELKWEKSAGPVIIDKYKILTEQAAQERPDLIVWPETSYPYYLWEESEGFNQIKEFVRRLGVPLLLGSVIKEDEKYYNTAILLSKDGEIAQVYRKRHLVPFGEFLPLRRVLPFLSELVGIGDFTPGDEWTVFPGHDHKIFSVLICFEDTLARLSRQFVQNGARLLINITNDAWFGDSRAPFMHLQSAVFRTVENRRGLVRAANTGVSCFIDPRGKIGPCVEKIAPGDNFGRRTYISGYAKAEVELSQAQTFYTKFGDIFTIICFACILWGIIGQKMNMVDPSLTGEAG